MSDDAPPPPLAPDAAEPIPLDETALTALGTVSPRKQATILAKLAAKRAEVKNPSAYAVRSVENARREEARHVPTGTSTTCRSTPTKPRTNTRNRRRASSRSKRRRTSGATGTRPTRARSPRSTPRPPRRCKPTVNSAEVMEVAKVPSGTTSSQAPECG